MSESSPLLEERRGVLGWVLRHPKSMIALVLLLLAVLTVLALQRVAENGLARRIAAIKAKGEPMTVADVLARQRPIPDEENLLLAVARAGQQLMMIKLPEEKTAMLPIVGTNPRRPRTGTIWTATELQAVSEYLSQSEKEMNLLHQAMSLKKSRYNIPWRTPAINILLPELSCIRMASKALTLAELRAAQLNSPAEAEAKVLEMLPMLKILDGGDFILSALVQMAISSLLFDDIERTINLGGISEKGLALIDWGLRDAERSPDLKGAFQAERVMFLDTMKWMRTGGPGPGWVASMTGGNTPAIGSAWRYVPLVPAIDTTEGLDLYTAMVDGVDRPDILSIQRVTAAESKVRSLSWYCMFSRMMIPALSRCVVLWVREVGQNRALRVAIGAERFRLTAGHWPESADQLVPNYLDAVPADPIDGKPIRYAIIPEGIKTWTIAGEDHDEDNGGDVQRIEGRPPNHAKDLGWVILNPELRGRPAPEEKPKAKKPASSATSEN